MQPGEARVQGLRWRPLGRRRPTIADLTLQVEPGEHVLLVGPSGAGKSTLLLALAGALGSTIAGELEGVAEVGGRLGLMVQNPSDSVVAERIGRDVAFGPENAGLARDQIWRLVDESLAAVGLDYGRDRNVAQLSGGEKQRLALAGSLATRPDVLLLDEPTSMLDEATAGRVRDAVLAAAGERTLIVVEHRFEPWLPHVDRVVVMGDVGVIVSNSSVEEFLNGPAFPGIWFPGRPTPLPSPCPGDLVRPEADVPTVRANDVAVELVAHGLRTRSARTRVLDGFSVEINPEHVVALVGASGSGKSTALAAMAGLRKLAAGRVTPEFTRLKPRQFSEIVGWVPQSPELGFVTHRVGDEVEVAARRLGRPIDGPAVLDQFGLASHADAHPSRLSGGEQRRLALASGLAHRPGLLLLDEPTVGQDPQTWAAVTGWLTAARDQGCGVVLATHDPQVAPDLAVHLPDRVGAR